MEPRISLITLGVRDLTRSRAFYERLGWRRSLPEAEGVAFFQLGGLILSLFPRADLAADASITVDDGEGFRGFALAYNTRDRVEVDAVLAEAAAAGATLQKPARETAWGGYSGYFADPDGILWEVAWNPGFSLDAEGCVRIPE